MSRYDDREQFDNSEEAYAKQLEARGKKFIRHYSTPEYSNPSVQVYRGLTLIRHVWAVGDRFYKLAHKHYGSSKYWWVIAQYNKTPTESHVKLGNQIVIPFPLTDAIEGLRG